MFLTNESGGNFHSTVETYVNVAPDEMFKVQFKLSTLDGVSLAVEQGMLSVAGTMIINPSREQ